MNHRKSTIIAASLAVLSVGGVAATANASEQAQIHFGAGTFAINPQTCKFLHPERDYPLGSSWLEGKIAFAYEDQRHDTKLSCLTRKVNGAKAPLPKPDQCWQAAGAPPAIVEHVDHPTTGFADVKGASQLYRWAVNLYACELQRNGAS